ncbi:MAG: hypothetical protein LBB91_06630 [Clostridiales bacterium]|jgi:uncharacterized protein YwgA|nr:hypothetical protein [Clostridiales bacterium]
MNKNLLCIIQCISNEIGAELGKKQLQKFVYIFEAKGINLGFEYGIHFYGPYSEDLNHELLILNSEGYVDLRITDSYHQIVPREITDKVDFDLSPEEQSLLLNIIQDHKEYKPHELELLTTTHFVAIYSGDKSDEGILSGVKKIKGAKYSDAQIKGIISHIRNNYDLSKPLAI